LEVRSTQGYTVTRDDGNTREVAETSFCPPMQKGALEAIDIRTSGGVGGKAAILLV